MVEIKWLYSNDCDHSGFISDGTEEELSSSDECENGSGLAAQLAESLGARLCLTSNSSLFPPLPTIEDEYRDREQPSNGCHEDYDEEDFEEPSLHDNYVKDSNDIMTQISLSNQPEEEVSISSSSSESCRTVTTIRISRKDFNHSKETNNNNNNDTGSHHRRGGSSADRLNHRSSGKNGGSGQHFRQRPASEGSDRSVSDNNLSSSINPSKPVKPRRQRSSSLPKSHSIVSNTNSNSTAGGSSPYGGLSSSRKMQKANHATIQALNNNNSCSSSEEGSGASMVSSSTGRPSLSSSPRARGSSRHCDQIVTHCVLFLTKVWAIDDVITFVKSETF